MPSFSIQMTSVTFATAKYSRALDEAVQTQIRQAAREFLRAASIAVPVRTGFARGSLQNISQAVGDNQGGPSLDNTPAKRFLQAARALRSQRFATTGASLREGASEGKGGKLGIPVEYYRGHGGRVLKTPQSGRQFATPAQNIFEQMGFIYSFDYSVAITYFNINEGSSNSRTPSAPWNAFSKGRAAFLTYLREKGMKRLPRIKDFLVEHKISTNGQSITHSKTEIIKNG